MIKVDALGKACPIPVVMTKKAMESLSKDDIVITSVDNEIAVENLMKMAKQLGFEAFSEKKAQKVYEVQIHVKKTTSIEKQEVTESSLTESCIPCEVKKENVVVVISSECMGSGDDQLGASLMKSFLYALSGQEELPTTLLFFNGGAKLTTNGSKALEDLKNMEKEGVEILTCGTCLDFYGLKEELAVGEVTNMYVIVEKMMKADKVIKN